MKSFEQYLNKLTLDDLRTELQQLFRDIPAVEEYYELKLSGNQVNKTIKKKYETQINDALYPDSQFHGGFDLDKVEEILNRMKQSHKIRYYIEIGKYAVKQATELANAYGGDYGEDFYIYFEELFEEIIEKAIEMNWGEEYRLEFKKLADGAFEGYGHYDQLQDVFDKMFNTGNH
ncbi:MAG: hypothetical protein AAF587_41780 [Bacteroidota bacterium]